MLLMLLKGMFGFAVRTGWAKSNPAASFARKDAGGKQDPRQRVLSDDELRAMWSTPTMHVGAIRLAILTGCRISEACGAEWTQIDLKRKRWTLPATRDQTKDGPLVPPGATDHRIAGGAAARRRPRFSWRQPQSRCNVLFQTRTRGQDTDPDYTLHDARRTMATRLGELGVNPLVVELLLGHKLPKVLATYNTAQYENERIAAAEMWGKHVAKHVTAKDKSNRAAQ